MSELTTDDLEAGVEITWTEEWTGGTKQFTATVVETETRHVEADLVTPAHDETTLTLDVTEGDADDVDPSDSEDTRVNAEKFTEPSDGLDVVSLNDSPDDDEEQEIVTDGGRDASEHITDRDLEVAIENRGAPVTVDELRDIVAEAQRDIEEWWPEHMDTFEDGHMTLVHEADDVLVFSDPTSHFWSEQLDALGIEDPETRGAVITAQHNAANRIADYNWSASYPVVIAKPADFGAGQDFDHRHLMWLMGECGLSGGVALDYLMVEWHGMSQNDWARRAGKDQGTVSQNVKKAKENVIR